jgi:hypothetical protein
MCGWRAAAVVAGVKRGGTGTRRIPCARFSAETPGLQHIAVACLLASGMKAAIGGSADPGGGGAGLMATPPMPLIETFL